MTEVITNREMRNNTLEVVKAKSKGMFICGPDWTDLG